MLQSTTNSYIIYIGNKYVKNISSLMKIASIENNSSVDPTDVVSITGEVMSIPKRIDNTREYNGFTTNSVKIGDIAIFSYSVVYDIVMQDERMVHKNAFTHHGKEYFLCDVKKMFGVIRGGNILMLNGYVMGTPIEESLIILPQSMRNQKRAEHSEIMHMGVSRGTGKRILAKEGDIMYVNPFIVQKYHINGKRFIITEQEKVLGIKT